MNKLTKTLIAILGGVNVVFSIFIPLAVAILIINTNVSNGIFDNILLLIAFISSLYRAIDVGFLRN